MKNLIVILILIFPLSIVALNTKDDSVATLDTMVITASKYLQSPDNVTQKVDIISKKSIESTILGQRNICELLSSLPGVSISVLSRNDANWGTYGGIGPKYSTYMLSGLPIDAFIDPMSLDVNILERIEVQRGPASVLYPNYLSQDFAGNQTPLAGTVNLILKESVTKRETYLKTSYGSYNTLNSQVYHQDKISGNSSYFGGISYENSDYTNYGTEGSWLNMKKNPMYNKTKFYGGLLVNLDNEEDHKFSFFVQKTLHKGDAGRVYRGFDHNYEIVNTTYKGKISSNFTIQSNCGVRYYDRSWQESVFGEIDTLKSLNGVKQRIFPIDISISYSHFSKSVLTIGGDYQAAYYYTWSDPLSGIPIYSNKSAALQGGGYVQEELRIIDNLTLRGGIRIAYIKNNIELIDGNAPGNPSQKWIIPLWSVGSKYTFNINDSKISLYLNGGNSFIAPGLKSIGGTIKLSDRGVIGKNGQLPNPDLRPECGIGMDGGIDLRLPLYLLFDVRGFYSLVKDAIVENRVSENPSQTQSINAGKASSIGGEFILSQNLTKTFSWFINFTYMKTEITNEIDPDQNGTEIPFAPKYVSNIGLTYTSPWGTQITPYFNYNGGYYDGSSKSNRKFFKPGPLINIYISQDIVINKQYNVKCFGELYNITNNKHEMPWQFKNTGFSGMGGVKINF